jgi:hypothetical protein
MSALNMEGWVPFRLAWLPEMLAVEWFYLGTRRFTEPFFEGTLQTAALTPFNELFRFRTPFKMLAEWHAAHPGLAPKGFIFHLSRCGSTLITQMLAALPNTVVLSEPAVLDRIIRSHERAPHVALEHRAIWLQWLVSALGQRRTGQEQHLFIKLEPRHILDLPFLQAAFPDVPWVFVYRDPVEVLVSNLANPCSLVTKGIVSLDPAAFDPPLAADIDDEEYAARMLGIVAETAARYADKPGVMLIDYRQLPQVVWTDLSRHFNVEFSDDEIRQMTAASRFNAKNPQQAFQADSESKRKAASGRTCELSERWILPHCRTLDRLRSR